MNVELLKAKILDLAIHGKLVPQLDNEPAVDQIGEVPDAIPFEIPEKWKWVKIQAITKINPKNKIEDSTAVSFIKMSAITQGYSDRFTQEIKLWKDVKKGFTHFAEGDVLVAKITPCFENIKSTIAINLKNGFGAGTTELHVLRSSEQVLSKYLLFFCKSPRFINDGVKSFTGTAGQQRISSNWIKNYQIPLPPIEEQQRIVAKINELFSILDAIDVKQKSLEEKLKLIKTKTLDLAIHGKLVPQLDNEPVVEQTGDVPDKIPFEIPEKWKWTQLIKLGKLSTGTTPKTENKGFYGKDVPFIKPNDITTEGKLQYPSEGLSLLGITNARTVGPKSIIMVCIGTIGKTAVTEKLIAFNQQINAIEPNYEILNPYYLHNVFLSLYFQNTCLAASSATTIAILNKKKWGSLFVPLSPLEEQRRIVTKINEIFSFCDKAMELLHK